jgi:HAD superfamily hydrolase (TIGR01509 family)
MVEIIAHKSKFNKREANTRFWYNSFVISTIIFDLSEVLLHGLLGIEDYLYQQYGLKVENSVWKIQELEKFFHGQITEDEYWAAAIRHYGWTLTVGQLKAAVRQNFQEIAGTREIIVALKKQGYTLGLLSIHAKEWVEDCEERFGYHQLFDTVMYSFEVAVSKPDKQAFHLILEKLQVKPDACLFIDDAIRNIESASEMGIHTIHFKNPVQLKQDLQNYKITVI